MRDRANLKLGRLPSKRDRRTLSLSTYRTSTLPAPPAERRWDKAVPVWGIAGNDQLGNCVIATAAHELLVMQANATDNTTPISDRAVISLSYLMDAENGYAILDRLKWWKNKGMWGNTLGAFAAIEPDDKETIRSAIDIFSAADIGLNLPRAWKTADVWDVGHGRAFAPGSWGGHSVPIVGYDADLLYIVTWGEIQTMTYAALQTYCDEAYTLINKAWLNGSNTTPSGYDLNALQADLGAISGGTA